MPQIPRNNDGTLPGIAWPGGYTILYLCADGESLCAQCANLPDASEDNEDPAWRLTAAWVHWEGPDEQCAHCYKALPSEYGDPDEDKEQ